MQLPICISRNLCSLQQRGTKPPLAATGKYRNWSPALAALAALWHWLQRCGRSNERSRKYVHLKQCISGSAAKSRPWHRSFECINTFISAHTISRILPIRYVILGSLKLVTHGTSPAVHSNYRHTSVTFLLWIASTLTTTHKETKCSVLVHCQTIKPQLCSVFLASLSHINP